MTGEIAGVAAGLAVGASLAVAGLLKLVEHPAWATQAADLNVPAGLIPAVPFVEVGVGASLVARLLMPWPAIAALALLIVFTVVIVRRLSDDVRVPCACFGSRSQRPLGVYHVVRNLVMIGLGAVAALTA